MLIEALIRESFPQGLDYDDAAQLCLTLYSSNFLSDKLTSQCTKENLPIVFSKLATQGFIKLIGIDVSVRYGANLHDPKDKGHWTEIIASIFKIGNTKDDDRAKLFIKRLTDT